MRTFAFFLLVTLGICFGLVTLNSMFSPRNLDTNMTYQVVSATTACGWISAFCFLAAGLFGISHRVRNEETVKL